MPIRQRLVVAYLLDTHVFLWWLADAPELPAPVKNLIASPDNDIAVSAVTAWEISIKRALGKLQAPPGLASVIADEGFMELPIQFVHGERAGELPDIHRDPFDRMLIAQCQLQGLTLITRDQTIPLYALKTVWPESG